MFGTLSIIDTLATYNNQSVLSYGEEVLAGDIAVILAAYERYREEMQSELAGFVPDRVTTYGTNRDTMEMEDLDEFGVSDAEKVPFTPARVGFPLRRRGKSLQWSRDYLANSSPAEIARQVIGIIEADERRMYADFRRAIFGAINNLTYVDRFTDRAVLPLRALVNADGEAIPPHSLTGGIFNGATHNHYLATASFIEANLVSLTETVREHGLFGGSLRIYINSAQEATVRGFAGFSAYTDPRLIYGSGVTRADQSVDIIQTEDRAIGIHGPAEVWVKPWVPASYVLAFRFGGLGDPVIGVRRPTDARAADANLRIVAKFDRFPLHAEHYQRMVGMSIWNRIRAAVLYTGGGSYVAFAG